MTNYIRLSQVSGPWPMPWNIAPSSLTRFTFLPFLLTWDVSWEVFSPQLFMLSYGFSPLWAVISQRTRSISCIFVILHCALHSAWRIIGDQSLAVWLTEWTLSGGQGTTYEFLKPHFPMQLTSKRTFTLQKRGTSKRPKASTPCGTIRCVLTNWNSCFIYKINPRRYLMTPLIFAFYHLACLLLCNAETHGQHWLGSFWWRSCSKTCTHYSLAFSLHILEVSFWDKIKLNFYFDAVKKHFNLFFQNTLFLGLLGGSVS